MGKTTRSPRKLRKKLLLERNSDDDDDFVGGGENNAVVSSVMMVSYRTPKSKLKSALKTTKKKRDIINKIGIEATTTNEENASKTTTKTRKIDTIEYSHRRLLPKTLF
tara:strand:- start:506 stop:829 length:324 start_codon:yes stop_codon:yes gene_type:complete